MLPVIPQSANDWLKSVDPKTALGMFPPNLVVHLLSDDIQQKIYRFMLQHYIWPQVMERQAFESMWLKLLGMYRIKLQKVDLSIDEATYAGRGVKEDVSNSGENSRVADSVFFDAVERLTCVTHFISFKEGSPIQYNIPEYYDSRAETNFYHPIKDRIQAGNCLLQWNIDNEEIYRKHALISRQLYQYGAAFVKSEFLFSAGETRRMTNTGQQVIVPEINKIGTSFEPLSIFKLFLNWRLAANEMDYQPCPFYFEETPRFATLQNAYDPRLNPFGFGNLDKVITSTPQWLYTDAAMSGIREVLKKLPSLDNSLQQTTPNILDPKYSVESLWTFYPMLPLDPETLEWEFRKDGVTPVPFERFIVQTWGENLLSKQIIIRLQRNFFPRDQLPLYGSAHIPDLESGAYPPSLGYLLWNHYREIVTCKNQYMLNKDRINDPPAWVMGSSPALNQNLNAPGAKIEVNSKNDFGWATVVDATQSTVAYMTHLREQAKTASKSDDAILGQAMGGRTSATEAQNVFQASMSALTTPINIFNYDIMGGFATRVWEYAATWFPPDLLQAITGQMGFALKPEDLWTRIGLKWDVASTYIESIVRQQNIRYALESSMGDPTVNRAAFWKKLFREWRFDDIDELVNDGGFEHEVYKATDQVNRTFLGDDNVMIDPDQNHQIAIEVKKSYLEDKDSVWLEKYPERASLIMKQILEHQKILQMQMALQMARMQIMRPVGQGGGGASQQPPLENSPMPQSAGAMMQQTGGPQPAA